MSVSGSRYASQLYGRRAAMNRKAIFATVKAARGREWDAAAIAVLDDALDELCVPQHDVERRIGPAGIMLIHSFEACGKRLPDGRLTAYPDPGSKDGHPWTIGWGSTGPGIAKGAVWTQQQADDRFAKDVERFAANVAHAIGEAPTTQNQFDAMVSFHYNTGAIATATLTKRHRAGDYDGAADAFGLWVKNDGRVMPGLIRRRAAEAALYRSGR